MGGARVRVRRRRFRGEGGTRLTAYAAGPEGAPTLVLCGGLGGGVGIWRPLFARFARRFRILSWDYRGLYRSSPARERSAYEIPHHAADLLALLRHTRVERPVLVGWSMGVQVALELHRTHPQLASGLVALHGTAGRPLDTAFESPHSARVAPLVLGLLRMAGDRLTGLAPRLARSDAVVDAFVWSSTRLGMMAEEIDRRGFRDMAEEWLALHLGIYADTFDALGRHDASDLLGEIHTPTLIVAGGADRFTPAPMAQRMAEAMPDARLEIVPRATHFGLLEFPDAILASIERFLEERLGDAGPARIGVR
jgi:pimeloyl-ACP methyl ester carboxylesterase